MTSLVSPARIKLSLVVGVLLAAAYLGLTVGTSGPNNIAATAPATEVASAVESTAPQGMTVGFQRAIVEGARVGNKDAQKILVDAARRGVEQAQRACNRLGLDWRR